MAVNVSIDNTEIKLGSKIDRLTYNTENNDISNTEI